MTNTSFSRLTPSSWLSETECADGGRRLQKETLGKLC
jgi:hypothetical protein